MTVFLKDPVKDLCIHMIVKFYFVKSNEVNYFMLKICVDFLYSRHTFIIHTNKLIIYIENKFIEYRKKEFLF